MKTLSTAFVCMTATLVLIVLMYFGWVAIVAASEELQEISSLNPVYATLASIGGYIVFAPAAMVLTYLGATTLWGWESWQAILLTLPGMVLYLAAVTGDYPEIISEWITNKPTQ